MVERDERRQPAADEQRAGGDAGTEHQAREQRLGQEAGSDRVEGVALAEERGGQRKKRAGDEKRDERAREQPAAAAVYRLLPPDALHEGNGLA